MSPDSWVMYSKLFLRSRLKNDWILGQLNPQVRIFRFSSMWKWERGFLFGFLTFTSFTSRKMPMTGHNWPLECGSSGFPWFGNEEAVTHSSFSLPIPRQDQSPWPNFRPQLTPEVRIFGFSSMWKWERVFSFLFLTSTSRKMPMAEFLATSPQVHNWPLKCGS
jgi:hypothetical protein